MTGDTAPDTTAARRWLLGAAFAYPPVAAALMIGGLRALDGLFTALLLVLLPALGAAQATLLDDLEVERLQAYASSAVTLAFLGGGALVLGLRLGGPQALGLVSVPASTFLPWAGGLLVGAVALVTGSLALGRRLGRPETAVLADLMPRTPGERLAFTGLSLVAGFAEEVAYRGYLLAVLAPLVGPWGAVAAGALPFALLHGYQGAVGVVRTGLLALALGASLVVAGSLWPGIVAHAAIDVVLGVVLGRRLVAAGPEVG